MQTVKIRDMVRDLRERGFTKSTSGTAGTYRHASGPSIHIPNAKDGADASSSLYSKYLKLAKSMEKVPAPTKVPAPEKPSSPELHHFQPGASVRKLWAENKTFGEKTITAAAAARRRAWALDTLRADPSASLRQVGETVRKLDGGRGIDPTTVMLLRYAVSMVVAPELNFEITQKTLDRAGHLQLTKPERKLLEGGISLEPLLATSRLDGYGRILEVIHEDIVEVEEKAEKDLNEILRGRDEEVFDNLKAAGVPVLDSIPAEIEESPPVPEDKQAEFREAIQLLFDAVWRTMPDCATVRIDFDTKVVKVAMKVPEVLNFDDIKVEFE